MNYSTLEQAVAEVTAGVREIDAEIERLKTKRELLETLVRHLLTVLPMSTEAIPADETDGDGTTPEKAKEQLSDISAGKPTWALARDVLAKSGGALTVPEIYKVIAETEQSPPAQDAIRIAMQRKPEIFIKQGTHYGLTRSQFATEEERTANE